VIKEEAARIMAERPAEGGVPVPMTREGLDRLQDEVQELQRVRRPEAAERVGSTRQMVADPLESGEYSDAVDELRAVEARLATLEGLIGRARLIESRGVSGVVELGSEVRLRFADGAEETYRLVGPAEADPLEGRISNESPLGHTLIGRRQGEEVEWATPEGSDRARILVVAGASRPEPRRRGRPGCA
jgi:transcription elongation factor GreA